MQSAFLILLLPTAFGLWMLAVRSFLWLSGRTYREPEAVLQQRIVRECLKRQAETFSRN